MQTIFASSSEQAVLHWRQSTLCHESILTPQAIPQDLSRCLGLYAGHEQGCAAVLKRATNLSVASQKGLKPCCSGPTGVCGAHCFVLHAGVQAGLPLPYRSQAKAVMPSEEEMEAVPEGPCRSVLMRSRMLRSLCATQEALPHFGLGLPGYVQVTSPIRRYTDLLAHWQLKVLTDVTDLSACHGHS